MERDIYQKIGVIGLGNIGRGVALALSRLESTEVLVWDQSAKARQFFETMSNVSGVRPAEMAQRASVILFVVPTTRDILACLRGPEGIYANARKGLIVYDLTTSYPADTRKVAKEAKKFDISYLDAGTSGGPYKADKGRLLTMVGGDRAAFERTRCILNALCEHVFYVGPSGTGHTLKLLHNIVCHVTTLATAEAGHMAERAGIPLKDMIDIFNVSNARSYATEFRFPQHIISKTWDGRSRIFNLHKDIRMSASLARELGADATFTRATLKILKRAMAHGMSEKDYTLLYRDFDQFFPRMKRRKAPSRTTVRKTRGARNGPGLRGSLSLS